MSGTLVTNEGGVARRLLHVLRVLVRHGFLRTLLGRKHLPRPEQVREAIEELGLSYIKFGQVLAIQRGFLPDKVVDELTPHEHSGKHLVGSIMITLGILGMIATVFGRARQR